MPIDPAAGFPLDPEARVADRLADLERRLAVLERGAPTIQTASGAPAGAPRSGTPYVDETAVRLYVRVAGVWRWAALT